MEGDTIRMASPHRVGDTPKGERGSIKYKGNHQAVKLLPVVF